MRTLVTNIGEGDVEGRTAASRAVIVMPLKVRGSWGAARPRRSITCRAPRQGLQNKPDN
ncbi:hypothetical protein I545_1369 [Mycobacterium kansasii 662]|uniref:Uncharacterized protein n=1 Tax=Mycobacterium kansasii 662 TaxID=1299326 RepID=X7ZQR7_MYCKA|nr:hypothetical protein I545_1369 [Mycobacterium kansasii 662]KEP42583.1 hypothetical protein MKSMC1_22690 [Mycobacterium kansasii]